MRFWLHNMPLEWTMENEADDDDAEDGLCLDEDDVYEAESLTHLHSMHQVSQSDRAVYTIYAFPGNCLHLL